MLSALGQGEHRGHGDDLGIYVHIPYCRSLCPYCEFNSYVDPTPPWSRFADALCFELAARAPAFAGAGRVRSIYFGGGTPSLMPAPLVGQVLACVARHFTLQPDREVTLEANPGSVQEDKLRELRALGVNRLSLGWQSTHDRLLRVLGRGHSAADSHAAFVAARQAGFENVSVDLIFAVPGQSLSDLDADLAALRALRPEHISLYALTYHEGTPYFRWLRKGRLRAVDDEIELAMMERIEAAAGAAGYEHYEISNYAQPGLRAVHNSLYWVGAPYLGVGPGAHSFWRTPDFRSGCRFESVRDPAAYLRAWSDDEGTHQRGLPSAGDPSVSWVEQLQTHQLTAERMLCGLRVCDGVDLDAVAQAGDTDALVRGAEQAVAQGFATRRGSMLVPTALGWRFADSLAALFF